MYRIETKYYSPKGGWSEWSEDFDQTEFVHFNGALKMINKMKPQNGVEFSYRIVNTETGKVYSVS